MKYYIKLACNRWNPRPGSTILDLVSSWMPCKKNKWTAIEQTSHVIERGTWDAILIWSNIFFFLINLIWWEFLWSKFQLKKIIIIAFLLYKILKLNYIWVWEKVRLIILEESDSIILAMRTKYGWGFNWQKPLATYSPYL